MENKKILVIGDIHGNMDLLKKIDYKGIKYILLTGDIGKSNKLRELSFNEKKEVTSKELEIAYKEIFQSTKKTLQFLSKKAKVYLIYGNVENYAGNENKISKICNYKFPSLRKITQEIGNIRIINNRIAKINGLKIGGLGFFNDINWVEKFKPEEYDESMISALMQTKKANRTLSWFGEVDILLTHQPPYKILDKVNSQYVPKKWIGKHAGSGLVRNYIEQEKPPIVICGHIHESKGAQKLGKTKIHNLGEDSWIKI